MKHKSFTTYTTALIAVGMFISYACTEQSLTANNEEMRTDAYATTLRDETIAAKMFTKTVGAPITSTLGSEWIKNYEKTNGVGKSYTLHAKTLKAILAKNCIGICFYYAIDSIGALHILPFGINEKGKLVKNKIIEIEGGVIDNATANQWIDAYPGTVKAHYWGSATLNKFMDTIDGNSVHVTLALSDDAKPQLLLSGTTAAKNYKEGGYLDASSPCPPVCP